MNGKLAVLAMAAVATGAAMPAQASAQVSVEVGAAAVSSYVWRGFVPADAFSLQPSITFGLGETGLALNVWGSVALQDRDTFEASDELDFTLTYDRALGPAGLTLGYIQYTFPSAVEGSTHSEEAFATLSFDHLLAPSISAFYDFGLIEGFYVTASVAPEFALGESAVLGLYAAAAISDYVTDDNGDSEIGLNDLQLAASVTFNAGGVSATPILGFSRADEKLFADESRVWGGISFGYGF